jgi:Calcineurin-like phosphoesterase
MVFLLWDGARVIAPQTAIVERCRTAITRSRPLLDGLCKGVISAMRIFAVSDLHTDFRENMWLVEQLSDVSYQRDILITAGDISDRLNTLTSTLALLRAKFRQVFYVPGNHELWVRKESQTSVEKFFRVLALCKRLDIQTSPQKIGAVWIVPLFSWYEPGFDADNSGDLDSLSGWADFYRCKWPGRSEQVCAFFLKMNEAHLRSYDAPVISFSHFLPRRDLLPDVERLRFKGLPKVAGCAALDAQIRRLKSRTHVFGHSHISCDRVIDGVRYIQNPLRYPRERTAADFSMKIIADSDNFMLPPGQAPPCRG